MRGGRRVGTPGRNYVNRTDMQHGARKPSTPRVAPADIHQPHGTQAGQIRSLQALPMGNAATTQPNGASSAAPPLIPPDIPSILRPTENPNEPVTTGIPTGPGAGPEVLPAPPPGPDTSVGAFLQTLNTVSPSPEMSQFIDYVASGRG